MLCTLYNERMEDGPILINSKQSVANGALPVATPEYKDTTAPKRQKSRTTGEFVSALFRSFLPCPMEAKTPHPCRQ